ncbi:hypothetical protein ABKN59_008136 [Abortiporus biennis]
MLADGNESLSSILGWMSISCWIVVYSPQIYENYRLKSGEALANLLPTIIILSSYYTACDLILLAQIYYYRWVNFKRASLTPIVSDVDIPSASEETPLLLGENSKAELKQTSMLNNYIKYIALVSFVLLTGVVAWAVDEHMRGGQRRTDPEEIVEWRSQLLGWTSAVMFLGARVPQIMKNLSTRCEGLSPALFIFSIAGNTTYVLSILAASLDYHHIVANGAWLAGSGLTVFLDLFVLFQFFHYQREDRRMSTYEDMS